MSAAVFSWMRARLVLDLAISEHERCRFQPWDQDLDSKTNASLLRPHAIDVEKRGQGVQRTGPEQPPTILAIVDRIEGEGSLVIRPRPNLYVTHRCTMRKSAQGSSFRGIFVPLLREYHDFLLFQAL